MASDTITKRGELSTSQPTAGANKRQDKLAEKEYMEIGSKLYGNRRDRKSEMLQASAREFQDVKK